MKFFRTLCIACALLVPGSVLHAQASAYGAVSYTAFGFTGGGYSNSGDFKSSLAGIIGGGFYTFPSPSRFKAGIDARVLFSPGYKGGSAYTTAFRVGFVPHHNQLRPYFQIGGGVVTTQLEEVGLTCGYFCGSSITISRVTSGVAQVAFGLDIRFNDHVDIRAFDYGADASASNNNSVHSTAAFLDAGVVYHFYRSKHS